jgi:hypothetical protein
MSEHDLHQSPIGNSLWRAGAGAGKTYNLVERVLRIEHEWRKKSRKSRPIAALGSHYFHAHGNTGTANAVNGGSIEVRPTGRADSVCDFKKSALRYNHARRDGFVSPNFRF